MLILPHITLGPSLPILEETPLTGSAGAMGPCIPTILLHPLWDHLRPLRARYRGPIWLQWDLRLGSKGGTSNMKWPHPNFPPPFQELRQSLTRGHFLINNNNTPTTHSTTATLPHIYTVSIFLLDSGPFHAGFMDILKKKNLMEK